MSLRPRRLLHAFNTLRFTVVAWALDATTKTLRLMPVSWARWVARGWGWFYGRFPTRDRRALAENLTALLGMTPEHAENQAKQIFINFAETLLDFFHPEGITVDFPDRDKLQALRREKGGVLMITFHMGNWELGARTMASWGWPVTAIYQPYQNKKLRKVIERVRAPGVNFIPVGRHAATGVRQALMRGDVVAMLGDHIFGETGVITRINGHPVRWPKGPLVLAVRAKAPIVVGVVRREGPRHYRVVLDEPIQPDGRGREAVEHLVGEVAEKFGRFLKRHPEQWYRFRPLETDETQRH